MGHTWTDMQTQDPMATSPQAGAPEAGHVRDRLQLFEYAARVARMCVYEYDHATGQRRWSDGVAEVLGMPPGSAPYDDETFYRILHPDDAPGVAQRLLDARVNPAILDYTESYRIIGADGTVRHIEAIIHFDRDGTGALRGGRGVVLDVSNRRRAEDNAIAEQARFRMAADAAGMGVFERNHITGTGRWSDRLWAIYGLEPREGAPSEAEFLALTHPDDIPARNRHVADLLASPPLSVRSLTFRIIRRDGAVRHVLLRSMLDRGPDGNQLIARGVVFDNTEAVVAEQALRASEARFRNAVDAVGLGVFTLDMVAGRSTWSARIWEIFSLPAQETGPSFQQFEMMLHPDDRARRREAISQARAAGRDSSGNITFRVVRADGGIRYLEQREVYERDEAGHILLVHGVVCDVTERIVAEETLRASETRFRNAATAARLGIFERNPLAENSYWSPRMWEIVGRPPRPLPPSREEFLTFIHPDDRARYQRVREALSQDGSATATCEFMIRRPDGTIRHVVSHMLSMPIAGTALPHVYGFMADVTVEHELRRQAEISTNLATLGAMASGIAHELSQPLAVIALAAGVIEAWMDAGASAADLPDVRASLARIERQVERAGDTINHMLKLARGGESRGVAALSDVIAGALDLVGAGLRSDGIVVDLAIPEDLPPVRGVQIELEQVLINLLINARDAMKSAPERHIRIAACQRDGAVMLEFEDSGGGIPPADLPRLFEPFFTTKETGKGTGLGLAICRKIMHASGGSISVSNGQHGACFLLCFESATR